jgi:hypothetical protein
VNERDSDYRVGYAKPPMHSQFRKGRSGNPKGRPRASRALTGIWLSVWNEKVTVTENGQRRRITKQEAAIKQLANKAAGGDKRAIEAMIRFQAMLSSDAPIRGAEAPSEERSPKIDRQKLALALLNILHAPESAAPTD